MTYHLVKPRLMADSSHPVYSLQTAAPPPLVPLSQALEAQKPPMDPRLKKIIIGVIVAVVVAAVAYWISQQEAPSRPVRPNRRGAAKKMSTNELAKNLYSRLEKRGGVADTTMRSLRALSKNS